MSINLKYLVIVKSYYASFKNSIDDMLESTSDEDILTAIKSRRIYEQTGNWPAQNTVITRLWEYFGDKEGSKYDIPKWKSIEYFYSLVCEESSKRWAKIKEDSLSD